MRRSYGFRRFGKRRYGKFSRRRYWNSRRRRGYGYSRPMRNITNKSLSRMGAAFDLITANAYNIDNTTTWAYQAIDWSILRLSADFTQFNQIFSTFIPRYIKVKWVPSIQQNASGWYVPGEGLPSPLFNFYDGFSTIRYDGTDNPISNNAGMQYNSFKTFNMARNWQTIIYPRRSQMIAPRQRFSDYVIDGPNAVVNDNIRGMGRLWIQIKVSWSDSDFDEVPQVPTLEARLARLAQSGHLYVTYYFTAFDRK